MRFWWLVLAVLLGLAPGAHAREARILDPAHTYRVPVDQAPARGPADALVTIVELSDFGCQFCRTAQTLLAELEHLYPGQLRLVYRHNPLDLEDGTLAAEASMAAHAQGLFWPMHDRIFANRALHRDQLEDAALAVGLDMARFRRDLDQRSFLPEVQADARIAERLGASSTPVFFINGRPIQGAQPLAVFARVIDEELARARSLVQSGTAPERVYDTIMATAREQGEPAGTEVAAPEPYAPTRMDPTLRYRTGLGLPGHMTGQADALLTVVVFSDLQCPYCASLQPILEALRAEHGSEVRIALRHLPLPFHPQAQLAAEAAVAAAAQGKLWAYQERIFAEPQALTRADLERHARALGLDMIAFRAALDDRGYLDVVTADMAAGKAMSVNGTPTLFFNGTPLPGHAPLAYIQHRLVEPKLAEARALAKSGVSPSQVYETLTRTADIVEPGQHARLARLHGQPPHPSGHRAVDPEDLRAAVLFACRTRDHAQARALHARLAESAGQQRVRAECHVYGVALP